MFRVRPSLALGVVLAVTLATPVAAYQTTGATVNEGLRVLEVVSLVIDSPGVTYQRPGGGSLDPGMNSTGQEIGIIVTANRAWELRVSGTDLSDGNGHVIPATARYWEVPAAPFTQDMVLLTDNKDYTGSAFIAIAVPASQAGGDYAGQLVFTLTAP